MRPLLALATALAALAALASPALAQDDPAHQSPFGGELPPRLERPGSRPRRRRGSPSRPPTRFGSPPHRCRARGAARVARGEADGAHPRRSLAGQLRRRRGSLALRGHRRLHRRRSTRPGAIFRSTTPLARGYEGAMAQKVNAPYVWIPLCLLFLAPFFDPRRPLRLSTWTCWCCSALGVSLCYFNRAEITASVAAHLSGARLLPDPDAGRRALAARARRARWCRSSPVRWLAVGGRRPGRWRGSRSTSPTPT